jgi:SpoVK/Ycf46/Vps4 family AAA+-type ATPase
MDNNRFNAVWSRTRDFAPRIVLLEDFDTVFNGRDNITGGGLTFNTVLNAIDGIEKENGLLLIITTNHIEKIDPAIGVASKNGESTRPGRIDVCTELPGLDRAGLLKIANRIVEDNLAAEMLYDVHGHESVAQFQERCIKFAVRRLWDEREGNGHLWDYTKSNGWKWYRDEMAAKMGTEPAQPPSGVPDSPVDPKDFAVLTMDSMVRDTRAAVDHNGNWLEPRMRMPPDDDIDDYSTY